MKFMKLLLIIYLLPVILTVHTIFASNSFAGNGAYGMESEKWEIYLNRGNIVTQILSDDNTTLWVGTNGGLEKRDAATGWLIRVLTTVDGLPGNHIYSLMTDGSGGIWIGTSNGLAHLKLDGSLEVLDRDNSELPGNQVECLISDGSRGLWIGTWSGGLAHLKADGSWEIFNGTSLALGLPVVCGDSYRPFSQIQSLLSDGNGGLWIGTMLSYSITTGCRYGGELTHLKADGNWEIFDRKNSEVPDGGTSSMLSDGSGGIWIATGYNEANGVGGMGSWGQGLAHFKSDGSCEIFNNNNSGLPANSLHALLSDGSGGVWIGTYNGGLAHLKGDASWEVFDTDNSGLPHNTVRSLLSDGSGGVWVGTYGRGLAHFREDGSWETFYNYDYEIPDNYISSLLSDGNGGVWVGIESYTGGLAHLKEDSLWEVFNKDNSLLPHNYISSILPDGNGGIWVGIDSRDNEGGLTNFKSDGSWEVFNTDDSGLPYNDVACLISDDIGGLWIGGGYLRGFIAHFSADGSWNAFTSYDSELPSNVVRTLLTDGSGGLWIGTSYGGLAHLKVDGSWEHYSEDDLYDPSTIRLPDDYVNALLSDGNGGILVGTNGGLINFRSDATKEMISGLPSSYVKCLASDNAGGIWIGTGGGGLAHSNADGSMDILNTDNSGLPHNYIYSLLPDDNNGVWIGTGDGLAHMTSLQEPVTKVLTAKEVYSTLEDTTIEVEVQNSGSGIFDQYSLVARPDGSYSFLIRKNIFSDEFFPLWEDVPDMSGTPITILELPVSGMASGTYEVYNLLVPAGSDPVAMLLDFPVEQWVLSKVSFILE